MSSISIQAPHSMTIDTIKDVIEKLGGDLQSRLNLKCHWKNDLTLMFARQGAKGSITITEKSVDVSLSLGLLLRPMKRVIENDILNFINTHIH